MNEEGCSAQAVSLHNGQPVLVGFLAGVLLTASTWFIVTSRTPQNVVDVDSGKVTEVDNDWVTEDVSMTSDTGSAQTHSRNAPSDQVSGTEQNCATYTHHITKSTKQPTRLPDGSSAISIFLNQTPATQGTNMTLEMDYPDYVHAYTVKDGLIDTTPYEGISDAAVLSGCETSDPVYTDTPKTYTEFLVKEGTLTAHLRVEIYSLEYVHRDPGSDTYYDRARGTFFASEHGRVNYWDTRHPLGEPVVPNTIGTNRDGNAIYVFHPYELYGEYDPMGLLNEYVSFMEKSPEVYSVRAVYTGRDENIENLESQGYTRENIDNMHRVLQEKIEGLLRSMHIDTQEVRG